MNAQTKRVSRLAGLAEKEVSSARAKVAEAARAVTAARIFAERAAAAWTTAAQSFGDGIVTADELQRQADHLRSLRFHADAAVKGVETATAEERRCTAVLLEATMDKRKLERWQDRLIEREREEHARDDRRGTDELAARTVRART
jgi:hypothetical protein